MLWFLKDKKEDGDGDRKKRRRSVRPGRSRGSERPDPKDRKSLRRRPSRRSTRSERQDENQREDTRDRDAARRVKKQEREAREEQEKIFEALVAGDEDAEPDEFAPVLGRSLNTVVYVLVGVLILGLAAYGVERMIAGRRAERVRPLQEAAATGDLQRLNSLIAQGVPIEAAGPDGGTPLTSAVSAGQTEAVKSLLEAGARPGAAAMKLAMRYEHRDIIEVLVRAGADPEIRGEWSARSPLELATEAGDMAMIRLLLAHGAEPDAVTNAGPSAKPALHYAAENNMTEVVELLLEYGADPATMWMGYAPKHRAEDAGHEEMVEMLVEAERMYEDARGAPPPGPDGGG